MKSTTSVWPFLRHSAFEFWSRRFTTITIPSSQRKDIWTAAMHGYWQAMMISFRQELFGSRGFSLSFLLLVSMLPFLPTLGYFFLPSLWWRMLGSRVGLLYSSGRKMRRDGTYTLVSTPRVGRRKWRWWTFPCLRRKVPCLSLLSLSLPRKVMTPWRLVLILVLMRVAFLL